MLLQESPDQAAHRLHLSAPPKRVLADGSFEEQKEERLWFIGLSVKVSERDAPFEIVIPVKTGASTDNPNISSSGLFPIPYTTSPDISPEDGAFAWIPANNQELLDLSSVRLLIGNEPVAIFPYSSKEDELEDPSKPRLTIEWLAPDRFVIRGLRALARETPSDAMIRLFVKVDEKQAKPQKLEESASDFRNVPMD